MKTNPDYYVYAYFDPRNYEMFYIGKGTRGRKDAHRSDKAGTKKERRIADIKKAGLEPNIKVVAINLTEKEAFLVEKALLWRPKDSLNNLTLGNYADHFRPPNSLHKSLPGFDTSQGVFFVNVGEFKPHRLWDDCYAYNFLASGYGRKYSEQLDRLEVGAIVAAYLSKKGYVGIGRVMAPSIPVRDFRFKGRPLTKRMLKGPELLHDRNDAKECEYLVEIKWIKKVPRDDARFHKRAKLFTTPQVVASLSSQQKTLKFLESEFGINFEKLLAEDYNDRPIK